MSFFQSKIKFISIEMEEKIFILEVIECEGNGIGNVKAVL
jgi:hypothetical protein